MFNIIFKIILAVIVTFLFSQYYGLVLSESLIAPLSVALLVVMVVAAIIGSLPFQYLLRGGLVLITWPLGYVSIDFIASHFLALNLSAQSLQALAPLLSCSSSFYIYNVANNRDQARDIASITLGLIAIYTLMHQVFINGQITLACISLTACIFTIGQMLILPPLQAKYIRLLTYASGLSVVWNLIA